MQKQYDAVVIGSGFGGSVSALRIAQAGKSVLVLERGKAYQPGEFPRNPEMLSKTLWRYPSFESDQGLYDLRFFKDMAVVSASGVGGGSLVYSNINVQPEPEVFEQDAWPSAMTAESLQPCYQKVSDTMGLSGREESAAANEAIEKMAAAGQAVGGRLLSPQFSIDWKTCVHCGECALGCNPGAKQSIDKNYLKMAVEKGAVLRSQSWVYMIEPTFGGYYIHYRDLAENGRKKQVRTRVVVLAAGTLGSNELLLGNRDNYDTLPAISKRLGHGFSANGNFFGTIQNASDKLEVWRGNDISAILGISGEAPMTLATQGYNQSSMELIASLGHLSGKVMTFLGPVIWRHMNSLLPWVLQKGGMSGRVPVSLAGAGAAENCTNLYASGIDNSNGLLRLKSSRLELDWSYAAENTDLVRTTIDNMQQVADAYGGDFSPFAIWNMAHRTFTLAPLGGCNMADDPQHGVVSPTGEVFGHPGLFVADGSIIPTALGTYPAMTIAAIAERIAPEIVSSLS